MYGPGHVSNPFLARLLATLPVNRMQVVLTRLRGRALLPALLAVAVLSTFWVEVGKSGDTNLYAQQARAFLLGRMDVSELHTDVAVFAGRYYVPFPPFPSIVLLPFVAALGVEGVRPVLVALALAGLSIGLFWRITRQIGVDEEQRIWLVLACFLGTGYWYVLTQSTGVWFFAHIVALACVLASFHESYGRGRGWAAGLWLGLAFLSRQLNLYLAPFVAVLLWQQQAGRPRAARLRTLLGFALPMALCVALYLAWNAVRFGNALDTGYGYMQLPGYLGERVARYGLFNIAYVPFNFVYMFLQGFRVRFADTLLVGGPRMDEFGTSLTFACPFLFAAFRAGWNQWLLAAAWLSVGLIIAQQLTYFSNGWIQANTQRYALDFLPVLMLLTAHGVRRVPAAWWRATVVYSVALNVLALVGIPLLARLLAPLG